MKNMTAAIVTELLIMGGAALAGVSNPEKSDYIKWILGRMNAMTDPGHLKSMTDPSLLTIVDSATSSHDYLLYTVYDFSIPGYRSRTIGMFGKFVTVWEENSFKKATDAIVALITINGMPVLDTVTAGVNAAE